MKHNAESLDPFLDAVAARQPTPGGGGVAAAAGALAIALARMVAAYSGGKKADTETIVVVDSLAEQLNRIDRMFRGLVAEDGEAYRSLSDADKRRKADPSARADYDTALGVAIAVPLEIAAVAAEAIGVLERLLPVANPFLLSDLGVAAALTDATVQAAAFMVRVNTAQLDKDESRAEPERLIDRLIASSAETRARIEHALIR